MNDCTVFSIFLGSVSTYAGICGEAGEADGGAQEALFDDVFDVQCLANCSVLVTEPGTGRVRLILDSDDCPAAIPPGSLRQHKQHLHPHRPGAALWQLPGVSVRWIHVATMPSICGKTCSNSA